MLLKSLIIVDQGLVSRRSSITRKIIIRAIIVLSLIEIVIEVHITIMTRSSSLRVATRSLHNDYLW